MYAFEGAERDHGWFEGLTSMTCEDGTLNFKLACGLLAY